jgi:putative Holliday junction resolvase
MNISESSGRSLGIDPGDKRIGVSVSDESGVIARPLSVIQHKSRREDAARIIALAAQNGVSKIIVGTALGGDSEPTPASRKAERLADEIKSQSPFPVILWDESGSTRSVKETMIQAGISKKGRSGHQDAAAAAVILQDYLDCLDHPESKAEKTI